MENYEKYFLNTRFEREIEEKMKLEEEKTKKLKLISYVGSPDSEI